MKLTPLHTLIRDYQLPSNVLGTMIMKSFFLCVSIVLCVWIASKLKKKRQSELAKLIPEKEKKTARKLDHVQRHTRVLLT